MKNEIDVALDAVRNIAAEKSDQISNELAEFSDRLNATQAALALGIEQAKAMRSQGHALYEQAFKRETDAIRKFTTDMAELTSIVIALRQQLENGEIVTGSKPRLVS